MIKFGEIRKPLLIFCLSASVAMHCGAVWIIHSHPLTLKRTDSAILMKSAPDPKMISKDGSELLVAKMEKALEESLNQVIAASHFSKPLQDLAKEAPQKKEAPPLAREEALTPPEPPALEYAASMPPLFDPLMEADLADFALDSFLDKTPETSVSEPVAILALPTLPIEIAPIAQTTEDDYTMSAEQFCPDALPSSQIEELTPQLVNTLKNLHIAPKDESSSQENIFTDLQESTTPHLITPNAVDFLRTQWIKRSMAEITLPDLDYYGLDKVASNLTWQEDLEVDVTFMHDPVNNKYIFSLTLQPEMEENYPSMKQNFYFVIDRSSTIEKHKLTRFKMAVQRSLAALCEGDSFNIYFIDKQITKLSENNLAVSPKTIQMAEEFLELQQSGKEPFRTLECLLPTKSQPDELHSFIFITDGNSLQNPQRQKKLMNQLAQAGERNIQFYTAAAGKGNNLVLLDLLSYASAGKFLYSDTNAGFPRKLVQLVKNLHNPIIKNPTIEISASASNARVELHPHDNFLPPLFAGQPYVITGTVDELCDLTLFIQGKNRDKMVNIRKRIALKEAPAGGRPLEKLWAESLSKICYEHFLENGKALYLREAEQIVAPFHGDIATAQ
ncbi:MAG: hypothetical protein JSS30_04845 [Verrucomicrobia bacterium]|nr:hypothetical protein [Verrucomicrobiota bacterium]